MANQVPWKKSLTAKLAFAVALLCLVRIGVILANSYMLGYLERDDQSG